MADQSEIRVVITGVASDLRKALADAKGDLGGLSAAIKAVPDKIKIDVSAEIGAASARLAQLRTMVDGIPRQIEITASADTGVARAQLQLLQAEVSRTETAIARSSLGGAVAGGAAGGGDQGGGGGGSAVLAALFGRGALGLAGGMTVGSIAGLGAGHLAMTGVGLAGFAGAGLAGGALLGAGTLGTMGVGGLSDMAVMRTTIANANLLGTALDTLQKQTAIYGANSQQAAVAQAALNYQMSQLGPAASALLAFATAKSALSDLWTTATATAQITATKILDQVLALGTAYVPRIAAAAQKNLTIINSSLKPLFAWLQGPAGVGIFLNLEKHFAQHLPVAMGAFRQGLELLLRVINIASNYTGGFINWLRNLLDRFNDLTNTQLNRWVGKMIEDFRDWKDLLKLVGEDIALIFRQGAGTAPAIVDWLTQMLTKLHAYLASTSGSEAVHDVFQVHKAEIIALLNAFAPLAKALGTLYLVLAPAIVPVVKAVAHVFTILVKALESLGPGSAAILGLTLVSAKLGVLLPTLAALGRLTGVTALLQGLPLVGKLFGTAGAVGGAGGGIVGVRGPVAPGSIVNPIAVVGGGTGAPATGVPLAGEAGVEAAAGGAMTAAEVAGVLGSPVMTAALVTAAAIGAAYGLHKLAPSVVPAPHFSVKPVGYGNFDPLQGFQNFGPGAPLRQVQGNFGKTAAGVPGSQGTFSPLGSAQLGADAKNAAAAFTAAEKTIGQTILEIRGHYQVWEVSSRVTTQNIGRDAGIEMARLHDIVTHSTGKTRDDALAAIRQLKVGIAAYFAQAVTAVTTNVDQMHTAISQGSYGAAVDAQTNFESFRNAVVSAVASGAESTAAGVEQIAKALNATLQAFGATKISVTGLTPAQALQSVVSYGNYFFHGAAGAQNATPGHKATGGLIQVGRPGEKGYDAIPMSVGGTSIVVGAGEQVAVFNAEQQQVMNSRLADMGGLGGMFSRHNRPHYMASGGAVAGALKAPGVTGFGAVTDIVKAALGLATTAANTFLGQGVASVASASSGAAPAGRYPGSLTAWLTQALTVTGHFSPANLAALAGRAMQESGGDPHQINLWDSNARAGHPSKGLLQTIDSTFASYMLPGHGDIWNPVDNAIAAIRYMFARYGHIVGPSGSGYAAGGTVYLPRPVTPKAAQRPPARPKIVHPKTPTVHVPAAISDSLKRLLPANVVGLDTTAGRYAQSQVDLSTSDAQLTYEQSLPPYPAQPLVTLTDADVAFMDPQGTLGLQAGDQLVNQSGMTVGRFFGPSGIAGGSWVPGIDQRSGQITDQLTNLYGQQAALLSASGFYGKAVGTDQKASAQRRARRARVLAFLRKQVIQAKAIQAELAAVTTGNLKQNVAKALSRQAITRRLGQLNTSKLAVSGELLAERQSQAALPALERNPSHTDALQTQLQGINDAISVENQLSRAGAATQAVQAAKSALIRDSLKNRLAAYAKVDTNLGGKAYDVGSGGVIGQLQSQIDAIDANAATEGTNRSGLAPALQTVKNAIAAFIYEQSGLPGTRPIQVRTPGGTTATTNADQVMLALVQQQLQVISQALAISQSQFQVFKGFAPLLAGRLVGSFQSGIDFVPQTGLALVHKGETILPDPSGPAGNRAAATVQTAQGDVQITIVMENNQEPLMRIVSAQMNQKALRVVSDHSGQRARLLSGVRRP